MSSRSAGYFMRALCIGVLSSSACQDGAPRPIGVAAVYGSGYIRTNAGRRDLVIRLDRQACVTDGNVNLRDASGLGILVMQQPSAGWAVRRYNWPSPSPRARGFVQVSGVSYTYPLWRGTTVITRTDAMVVEGEIDWTVGEPRGTFVDTTSTRVRVVGRFSAAMGCDD